MRQKKTLASIETAASQFLAGWNFGRIGSHSGRMSAAIHLSTVQGRSAAQAATFSRFLSSHVIA